MQYITKYKVKSNEWPGEIILTYEAGELTHADNMRNIEPAVWDTYQKHLLPVTEERLQKYAETMAGTIIYEEVKIPSKQQKVAMFCAAFVHYNNGETKYTATTREGNNLTNEIEVTPELLKAYFENDFWPPEKSITNYVRNINNIRVVALKTGNNGIHSGKTETGHNGKIATGHTNRTGKGGKSASEMAQSLFDRRHSRG